MGNGEVERGMWMYLDERGLNSKSFKEAPKIQTNKLKLKRPKIAC